MPGGLLLPKAAGIGGHSVRGFNQMSDFSSRRVRTHALAAATAVALAAMAGSASAAGPVDRVNLSTLGTAPAQGYDRFIVKYREGTQQEFNVQMAEAAVGHVREYNPVGQPVRVAVLRKLAVGGQVLKADRKLDRMEAAALMRAIAADPDVLYVEVDQLMKPLLTPNDTYYSQYQWDFHEAAGGMNIDDAWNTTSGAGVVVAVLDTGITTHSDLSANIIGGYDFISDSGMARDGNGRDSNPADQGDWSAAGECGAGSPASNSSWHGTHVAGTVAAVTNNAKGMAGVAYGAKVVPVRVLGKCGGYTSDISDAIIWASGGAVSGVPANANPAEVINMSLGGAGSCSATYQNAINGAVGRGSTVVVAAGNSNTNVSTAVPANCQNVVAVASTTRQGGRSSFSNYGSGIDVAAPGSDIASTLNSGTTTPSTENYAIYSGTSMAAPHVAGVVAMMQSVASSPLTPASVESMLKDTLRAFPVSIDQPIGNGIVDAQAAVAAAAGGGTPPPPPPGGGSLADGVPVTGLSGAAGSEQAFTLVVPSGATNLVFQMSGGTGDADMYVRFGSRPTTSSYDCRPYLNGNNETCTFSAPQAGTYHVVVRGYSSFSGVSLVGNFDTGSTGGGQSFWENTNNYSIYDRQTTESPITVSGRSGNAPSNLSVDVNIVHTYKGDLVVNLVAPDGSTYLLHNGSGGSANNIVATYTVNASSEAANGTWKLRVYDRYNGDTGYINGWSLTF